MSLRPCSSNPVHAPVSVLKVQPHGWVRSIIGFSDSSSSSTQKGESLRDTIKTVANYSDIIIMRHPREGSARFASEVSGVPVINAGDGSNQHPTQTLFDMYSIRKTQGTLNNLNIAFVGDLKYGRTVHSLVMAFCNYNTTFHLVSPHELKLPSSVKMHIKEKNLAYYQYTDILEVIPKVDILYMTRIQKERFPGSDGIREDEEFLHPAKQHARRGQTEPEDHASPPRVNEITVDVDDNPKAYYFTQALNGVYVRQAILAAILGVVE